MRYFSAVCLIYSITHTYTWWFFCFSQQAVAFGVKMDENGQCSSNEWWHGFNCATETLHHPNAIHILPEEARSLHLSVVLALLDHPGTAAYTLENVSRTGMKPGAAMSICRSISCDTSNHLNNWCYLAATRLRLGHLSSASCKDCRSLTKLWQVPCLFRPCWTPSRPWTSQIWTSQIW